QVGMLGLEERDAPLAVEHHRELAALERMRGRELVARSRLPLDKLVVAVGVDQALLPREKLRPPGILREGRPAGRIEILRADERLVASDPVLVEAKHRVEPDDVERSVTLARRQLLRVRRQLLERSRRMRQARLLEEGLVVVEA